MSLESFSVRVPASTSNLGSGFDVLSAALSLHLQINVVPESQGGIRWQGWDGPPEENLLDRTIRVACKSLNVRELPDLSISMHNPVPLGRGLGSSGAAIIGGVKIAERLAGVALTDEQILEIGLPLEGHPDNMAASLMGGWVVSCSNGRKVAAYPLLAQLETSFVVLVPESQISTSDARNILPNNYSREDVVFNLQRCGLMVGAICQGKSEQLRMAMQDRLHQPFRARLVPGLLDLLKGCPDPNLDRSIMGIALSGSGSSVVALARENRRKIGAWMVDHMANQGIQASYQVLELDRKGAVVEEGGHPDILTS